MRSTVQKPCTRLIHFTVINHVSDKLNTTTIPFRVDRYSLHCSPRQPRWWRSSTVSYVGGAAMIRISRRFTVRSLASYPYQRLTDSTRAMLLTMRIVSTSW